MFCMMRRRLLLFSVMFGTAASMFLAGSFEYRGLEYMPLVGALVLAAVVGTLVFAVLAVWAFLNIGTLDVLLAACCTAGLPFLVEWLLRLNETQLNLHGGYAVLGFLAYGLGSELCAIALLIAVVVRSSVRLMKRKSAQEGPLA
jgi:hypothetical protein